MFEVYHGLIVCGLPPSMTSWESQTTGNIPAQSDSCHPPKTVKVSNVLKSDILANVVNHMCNKGNLQRVDQALVASPGKSSRKASAEQEISRKSMHRILKK
ncbi:hypothetical protein J6590_085341 [Homalodisca vitripennis]|nr:hypothetical protein J6590_085341 [Homalodisca vitripennis]